MLTGRAIGIATRMLWKPEVELKAYLIGKLFSFAGEFFSFAQ
jgi:hypothetical protein